MVIEGSRIKGAGRFCAPNTNNIYNTKMISNIEICESRPSDVAGIEQLYKVAFPEEDLLPLMRGLLGFGQSVISLVGTHENIIVGHVCFTLCQVEGGEGQVALLGPLAETPAFHKQGIGDPTPII